MTAHLLSISIGPVQEFIAAGRKTRDLWFGSYLLSEASRASAAAVQRPGVELIFPDASAVAAALPVANKILAWVDAGIDPAPLAKAARAAAQARLLDFRGDVEKQVNSLPLPERRGVDMELLDAQLAAFLEFAAAWHPADDATYQTSRREVELLLAGRKALRDFSPAHGRDGVPKSALDPALESVIRLPRDGEAAEKARRRLRLKGAEQLDGVSLVKRLANPRRFVSVARVAIDPFVRRAAHDAPDALAALAEMARSMAADDHPSVESFADTLDHELAQYEDFPFDTQLFYDDQRSDPDIRDGRPSEQQQAQKFFAKADGLRRALGISTLPTYFAVLVADGDRMGAAISGMATREEHRALSARLTGFAAKADKIVRDCQGAMVYSGGDDVLAFLPLDQALACADRLRREFSAAMAGATGGTPVSLSVGVAIGHYGEHLQRLLQWGREAERAAKGPRNALAVSLHTRGAGEGPTVVHPWTDDLVPGRWNQWVTWHRCDLIPDSAAYELSGLEREFRRRWPEPAQTGAEEEERRARLGDLLRREVRRVLGRRRAQHGEATLDAARLDEIAGHIGSDPDALRALADELLITRRIAAATDVAAGKPGDDLCAPGMESDDG